MSLNGKTAFVTGAASGIARATAHRLAADGATVIAADVNDAGPTVKEIEESGGRAESVTLDVRSADQWERVVGATVAAHGRIDCLANIAGVVNMLSEDTIVGLTEEAWDNVLDTNLRGAWLGMRAVIPGMIAQGGGRIVNISSMAAKRGLPNLASYSASKGGIIGLTQQAAFEYGPDNVLVNAICPGTIDTPILGDITPEMKAANAGAHIIERLGEPSELASMIAYLFREGSFLTGEIYPVDGGWAAKGNF